MGKTQPVRKNSTSQPRPRRVNSTSNKQAQSVRGGHVAVSPVLGVSASVKVEIVRQKLGISQEELARVTGYSTRSIAGWEAGRPVSVSARQKLTETDRLRSALAQIVGADHLGQWLRTPNPAFEGQTPIQLIERGESDRLWRMVHQINANVAE